MSTSLKEQLLRLQTPQSSLFVDSKRRDSILFSPKEAATKSRETIYEIGLSGLQELIDMDASFAEFENTLFNFTARDVQRAVETSEVNKLLNKNIKRFMFHLSPYFMIPSSHKCLEWLIRRFNINLYNKEEMLMLILPYHQTNMFVRCVQTMKFNDPSDKWSFLAEVKKSCSPLSKLTLWNHGASQPAFLDFVGRFTYEATKELSHSAGKLQTMFSFYFTSCVGSLEHASVINDNHILAVSKYLIKTYNSAIVDFTAAGYMITAQLVAKVSLAPKLLYELMDKLTKNINVKLSRDCFLLLALIFQTQSEELRVTDKVLENLLNFTKLLAVLKQVKDEDKIITEFYKALIYKILKKLQDKDENFEGYSDVCEKLLNEIDMDDELAQVIIRTVLDSYIQDDTAVEDVKPNKNEKDIISLDSEDEENIPLKSQDITKWYSNLLKKLERQYPVSFDLVVKDVMTRNPQRRRNGLKNVIGFLMNVSCSNDDTNVFENLYHHNPHVRSEAVTYLVKNLKNIERTPENAEILKMTLNERLSDDSADVVIEILKMNSEFLIETIGLDELVAKLSKIIMKHWRHSEKWEESASLALKMLTKDHEYSDPNIVILAILPFAFECNAKSKKLQLAKNSSKMCTSIHEMLKNHAKVPSTKSLLSTIQNVLINNHRMGSFSENVAFYLLSCSLTTPNEPAFSFELFQTVQTIIKTSNSKFNNREVNDTEIMKAHEISIKLIAKVLNAIINTTDFSSHEINLSNQSTEMKLIFEMFKFIIDLFFKIDPSHRDDVNEIMIALLEKVCQSDEIKKLQFFSQFCVLHAAIGENLLEFQIRTMGLLNHVLKTGQIKVKHYSNEMYQNIVISLASPISKVREFGIDILSTLLNQTIAANWKFVLEKLMDRKEEIAMDGEQIKMVIYLLASKKTSKYVQEVINSLITRIAEPTSFDYIQSELLQILKYFTDRKVLDVSTQIAINIIDEFNEENYYFNESHAAVIKLVLLKINQGTISSMWNVALKAIKCHHIMNDDGRIITPSIVLLQCIDSELFAKLHPQQKREIFNAIIECSMNEQARIVQVAQKVFFNINLDYKMIQSILQKLPKSLNEKDAALNEWKFGVKVLELLQNKTEGTDGQHELLPVLFDVLSTCLQSQEESEIEYVKQIVLSLILSICKIIAPEGSSNYRRFVNNSIFKTELIIKCIKESQNPQTHHHSLLLLAHMALMIPEQVLRDITTIFTFVGTALVRHDDSYSFQIITKIIENIIPNLLKSGQEKEVMSILKTFATIVLDVPVHRRMLLYVKLLETLNAEKYLWMFIACVLETQVNQPKKSKEEDLPPRLQTALAIAKEFDLKTIVGSTTLLVMYLKELPAAIDVNKHKQMSRTKIEDEIFPLDVHSNKNLRHFKYLITLFVKHILESPEISAKTYQMSEEKIMEMKSHYQNLILNTLIWLPDVNKSIELKQNEVYWQLILQIYFDILEATIALLAPDMLLIVVERLIDHENLIVRKKVLELLNRKLDDDYFKLCESEKVLKLMVPLEKVCETIGMENISSQEENIQQLALISVKLLARKLSEDNPDHFVECLNHLTSVMNSKNLRKSTIINLIDCVAELVGDLKVYSISLLGRVVPSLVKYLQKESSSYHLLYAATSSLQRVIEAVPLFMSPYLVQIIEQLIKIAPPLKSIQDTKVTYTLAKIKKIWESVSQMIPLRVLYPAIDEIYDSINQKRQFNSVEPLMELMNEIFKHAETKDIRDYQVELTEFFLKAMKFRCEAACAKSITFEAINDIELFIIRALIALILKLSEGSFRPLFENITNWAIKDKEDDDDNRVITFFRFTTEVSAALKSLFLLFASDVVDSSALLLNKCNPSKENDESFSFGNDSQQKLFLTESILQTLNNMFLNDHQNFINARRFDTIMQPIVDQLENEDALGSEKIQHLIRITIAQLAVAVSDDILWKQLNYQVLLKTRSDNPEIRIFGVRACVDVARKLTEDFEALVPETIPFLSELLEDEDHTVVEACQNSIRELEVIVGESLQKYF